MIVTDLARAASALEELFNDREFGKRMHASGEFRKPLIRYFFDRGLTVCDANLLASAYLAGTSHTMETANRQIAIAQSLVKELLG